MFDKFYNVFLPQPLIWRSVKDYEGVYEVSNYGNIRSLDRWVSYIRKGSVCSRKFKGQLLKPKYDKDGYESYCLTFEQNKKHVRGHRIVAEAFLDNNENLSVVDHKDAKVVHNFSWNLQWMTSADNTIKYYSEESGLDRPLSSLSKFDWYYIGYLYNEGFEYKQICENLGIGAKNPDTIWEGLSGKRLTAITGFTEGDFTKRRHPNTKISTEDVCEIVKKRFIGKKSLKVLAREYEVAESLISRFCSGKRQPEGLKLFKEKYKGVSN